MPERLAARAQDIMNLAVVTVRRETAVADVLHLLADHHASCAVVVDNQDKPTGIVSERDLLALARSGGERVSGMLRGMLQEEHHVFDALHELRKSAATNVADIASTPVACVDVDDTITQVAARMEKLDYRQLPVVRDGKVVGIITRQEVVRAIADRD